MIIGGWMSLLMACKQFGNNRLGKLCFSRLVELDPKGGTGYMLMLGIHADESVNKWTEVNDSVNGCVVGDKRISFQSMKTTVEYLEYTSGLDGIPDFMTQQCNLFDEYKGKSKSCEQ